MTPTHTDVPLVGRERELAEFTTVLAEAREGRGSAVFIGGEPGVGKSRLADEVAGRAAASGHLVLWGRGWEDAGATSYWPWVQVLRALVRGTSADAVRRHGASGIADIAQLLPELRHSSPELPPATTRGSDAARFQLFDSVVNLIRVAAADQPLLIVLDDLQAADTSSILLLQFLSSQVADMSVLLVGTYRDIELVPSHPLTAALANLARQRGTHVMLLRGLELDAVGAYISSAADAPPRDDLVEAVWRETKGNPLFVGEAVQLLKSEGRLEDPGDITTLRVAVPEGVRAVIRRRLEHLDPSTVRMLEAGAAVGPEFDVDVVRQVLQMPAGAVAKAIDEATVAGLLLRSTGSRVRYRISHDLVRETLHAGLAPSDRTALHGAIAGALELLFAHAVDEHLTELAFHTAEAAEGLTVEDPQAIRQMRDKAIGYGLRAGDGAARAVAYEEAARLYSRALRVLRQVMPPDLQREAETLLRIGDVQSTAGAIDDAKASYMGAASIARELGSGTLLAKSAIGYGGRHQWARPGRDTELVPLLEAALELLGDSDPLLRVRLLTRLAGAWRQSRGRQHDSARLSREAIELARRLGDVASLTYALAGRFWATWWPDNPEERSAISSEIAEIAVGIGTPELIADAHLLRFMSLTELGRMSEARREMDLLTDVIEKTRQPTGLWLDSDNRAWMTLFEGRFDSADVLIGDELDSSYHVTPAHDNLSSARMHRFLLRREQGRLAEEEGATRASVREFPWYPLHRAALACLLAETGRRDEAQSELDRLGADRFAALLRDNEWLLGMCLASDAASQLADRAAAAELYAQLIGFAGRHAVGHAEGSVGVVDRYLGLLAECLERYDDAAKHLSVAVGLLEEMGGWPWRVHAQHELARVLRKRDAAGGQALALAYEGEAFHEAERLGMALALRIRPALDGATHSNVNAVRAASDSTVIANGMLRREGDVWAIRYGASEFRLRDAKGLRYLAVLLAAPGAERHSLDLIRVAEEGATVSTAQTRTREPDLAPSNPFGSIGPLLDAEAVQAYRSRVTELREALVEAASWNDPERAHRLQQELDSLTRELAAAMGLGGRARATGSAAERARISVTRAIRGTIHRINAGSPRLGDHLAATIRTGTFCAYVPDPRAPIEWEIST